MPIKRKGPRIAVVGAGIAGLSCATVLRRSGFEVNVFDKSRGPAGRMSTRRQGDWQCDHGAQYFTARDPLFQAEVARWQNAGVAAIWPARIAVLDGSAQTAWASKQDRFVGTPSMNSPAKFLADAQSVTLGCTVTALHQDGQQWRLASAEQGMLADRFDVVVLEAFALHGGQKSTEWTAHRWRLADTEASEEPAPGYIWDEASGLALCGDWLNGGRVEGAWHSDRMLGERIATC